MSTGEVIAAAQAVIDEAAALAARKTEAISTLREQRAAIDQALEALGDDPNAKPRKPRKALSDEARRNISEAQKRRHAKKGGTEQSTTTVNY